MVDITMNLNDTLELDTIIRESNVPKNPVGSIKYEGSDSTNHNLTGIQTNTAIFDPQESGNYTIPINGQELTVKVTDPNTIPDSAVSKYEFEQDVKDTWGNNDGTDNTSAGYSTNSAVGSSAKAFDGTDDYVDISGLAIDYQNDSWTFTGWLKTSSSADQTLFGLGEDTDFRTDEDNSGNIVQRFSQGGNPSLRGDTVVDDGQYHLWTVAYDISLDEVVLYLDDSQTGIASSFGLDKSILGNVRIGYRSDDFASLDGFADDVRVYNKQLTATEVSNLYNNGSIRG